MLEKCSDGTFCVSYDQHLEAKMPRGGNSRVCSNNVSSLKVHLNSFGPSTMGTCQVCFRTNLYIKCFKCNKHCCYKDGKGMSVVSGSIDMHDDRLCLEDRVQLFGELKKNLKNLQQFM